MLIYACVSGHGFGHGSRSASVLTALAKRQPSWRIVLSTPLAGPFLTMALGSAPFEHRPCRWDVGVIQADALGADPEATLRALGDLDALLGEQIEQELTWLRAQAEPVLVLADVPPAAALLAGPLAAPLVWLANFGWESIYGPMGERFSRWADQARELYGQGDLLLRCPLSMPMDWGIPELQLGLTCGEPRLDPHELRRTLNLPEERELCVLVSFGGMGLAIDPTVFAHWPEFTFLCSDPGALSGGGNVRLLPPDLRPLELMPLCARMVTKPGYSSFCEALSLGVGLHVVHREGFAEAAVLEEGLRRHGAHRLLSQAQLKQGDWQLDQPLLPATGAPLAGNGAQAAAQALEMMALGKY